MRKSRSSKSSRVRDFFFEEKYELLRLVGLVCILQFCVNYGDNIPKIRLRTCDANGIGPNNKIVDVKH